MRADPMSAQLWNPIYPGEQGTLATCLSVCWMHKNIPGQSRVTKLVLYKFRAAAIWRRVESGVTS